MVEVKDGKKILTTPISAEDLKGIISIREGRARVCVCVCFCVCVCVCAHACGG